MRQLIATAALLATGTFGLMLAGPAAAQPHQRTLIIYGEQQCPQSNGEEIVVCERRPANEQFRIPKELRTTEPLAGSNDTAAGRVAAMDGASQVQTGLDTCSPVGAGGHTGCFRQAARSNKAARKADVAEAAVPADR